MEFDIQVPQLALVWFQVMDYEGFSKNELVSQYCLPFTSLQQGQFNVVLLTNVIMHGTILLLNLILNVV